MTGLHRRREEAPGTRRGAGEAKRCRLAGAAVVLTAAALGGAIGPAAAVELVLEPGAPAVHVMNQAIVMPWTKDVERLTRGRVKLRLQTAGVAPAEQQFDLVLRGFADAAYQSIGAHARRAPLMQIATLPLINDTGEATAVALWRTYSNYFSTPDQYPGVVLVGVFAGAGGELMSFKEPITSIEALRRHRLWSVPGASTGAMAWLGVTPASSSWGRLYEAVGSDAVDGISGLSIGDAIRFNVAQRVKSVTLIPGKLTVPAYSLFMNRDVWRKLPERDRAQIESASGENLARRSRAWDRADDELGRKLLPGRVVVAAPPQFVGQLKKAWQPLYEEWMAEATKVGVDGKAAFAYFVSQVEGASPGAKDDPPADAERRRQRR
jgi:TRAP-type C4-dicarboxylate transport system substrate-binding protein